MLHSPLPHTISTPRPGPLGACAPSSTSHPRRGPAIPPTPSAPQLSRLSTYRLPAAGVVLRARAEKRWRPPGREVGSVGGAGLGSAGSVFTARV